MEKVIKKLLHRPFSLPTNGKQDSNLTPRDPQLLKQGLSSRVKRTENIKE